MNNMINGIEYYDFVHKFFLNTNQCYKENSINFFFIGMRPKSLIKYERKL